MGNCACVKGQSNSVDLIIKEGPESIPTIKRKSLHTHSNSIDELNKSRLTNYSESEKQTVSTPEMVFVENTNEYIRKFSVSKKGKKRIKNSPEPSGNLVESTDNSTQNINIVLCGDSGVGKSALVIRYTENDFDRFHIISISIENGKKTLKYNGKIFNLNFVVTPGDPNYISDFSEYYSKANFILFVFDFTNKDSFSSIMKQREKLLELNLDCKPIMCFIGNKCECKSKELLGLDCKIYCEDNKIEYFEVFLNSNNIVSMVFLIYWGNNILRKI